MGVKSLKEKNRELIKDFLEYHKIRMEEKRNSLIEIPPEIDYVDIKIRDLLGEQTEHRKNIF